MAKSEISEETGKRPESTGAAELLIAVVAPVDAGELRIKAGEAARGLLQVNHPAEASSSGLSLADLNTVIAYPAPTAIIEGGSQTTDRLEPAEDGSGLRFLPYPLNAPPSVIPWLGLSSTYQALFGMARELGVNACVVISPDLAALKPAVLGSLWAPVSAQRCDLAMPVYPVGKFEALLNRGILAPLSRTLYGRRVRFPLAPDFGISARLLPELEQPSQRISSQGSTLFWPASEAALRNRNICQVYLDVHHSSSTDNMDLSAILTQTVGPLFAEMEANAPFWQRARISQPLETLGPPPPPVPDGAAVDVRPMLETFDLGFRNLQEVWGLVLPPVTLLELKRLTRMIHTGEFRMPDEVWVRIVYDFALAYRLRTLSRSHLMGALTPLYLGWVASHVLEVSKMRASEVEQRVERLARAYEDGRPYLLSRWRWPDRFNP